MSTRSRSKRSSASATRRARTTQAARSEQPTGGIRPLPGRKPLSNRRRIITLVLGDALVFLVFASIGLQTHKGLNDSIGAILATIVLTALPFAAGWFLVAPFVGAYKQGLEVDARAMYKRTLIAWVASWPVAMILRGIFVDHGIPPLTFWVVSLISIAIIMLVWRVPFAITHSANRKES